jgi:hypothetical protein
MNQPQGMWVVILVKFIDWTPIIDQCVVRWGSKTKYYEATCLKEIGLHLQILWTTPHSTTTHKQGGPMHLIKVSTNMCFMGTTTK